MKNIKLTLYPFRVSHLMTLTKKSLRTTAIQCIKPFLFHQGTCVSNLQTNDVNSVWFLYWDAVTLLLKLLLPMPIGTVCAFLILWRIIAAGTSHKALIHTVSSTGNNSGGRSRGARAAGMSKNTHAMLLLSGIYISISLPNIIDYILISLASFSCTTKFIGLLANDLFTPISRLMVLTRIFDGFAFLVIPEFRSSLATLLRCGIRTKAINS